MGQGFVLKHRVWLVLPPTENPSKYIKPLVAKGFQLNYVLATFSVIRPKCYKALGF